MIYLNTYITLTTVPWNKFKLFSIAMYDLPLQWLHIKWEKCQICTCNSLQVLNWATWWLYHGACLTKCEADPKADEMSSWPDLVLLLATWYLYWGVCLSSGQPDPTYYHSWPLVASTRGVHLSLGQPSPPLDASTGGNVWVQINQTNIVPLLATRCHYLGYVWPQVNQTQCSTTLHH